MRTFQERLTKGFHAIVSLPAAAMGYALSMYISALIYAGIALVLMFSVVPTLFVTEPRVLGASVTKEDSIERKRSVSRIS